MESYFYLNSSAFYTECARIIIGTINSTKQLPPNSFVILVGKRFPEIALIPPLINDLLLQAQFGLVHLIILTAMF